MSPIPVDPGSPEADRSPSRSAPAPRGAPAAGVERGPATVRLPDVARQHLIANVTTSFLWFALTFWAYLETRSVMATAIGGGSYMLFLAVFGMVFRISGRPAPQETDHGGVERRHPARVRALRRSMSSFGEEGVSQWQQPGFWIFVTVILTGAVVEPAQHRPVDDRHPARSRG